MKLLDWLLCPRRDVREPSPNIQKLVAEADHRTEESWRLVNQSRRSRGQEPIRSHHFRPRDLIDPRSEEDGA